MCIKNFIILFFFFAKYFSVQSQNNYECELIKVLLSNKEVKRCFYIDFTKDKEIVFVDNKLFFQNCTFGKMYNKDLRIVSDSSVMEARFYNGILISNIVKKDDNLIIYLYQKSTGAAGNVKIKIRRKKYSVVDVRIGNY